MSHGFTVTLMQGKTVYDMYTDHGIHVLTCIIYYIDSTPTLTYTTYMVHIYLQCNNKQCNHLTLST